jgi:hypothetical protein
MMQVIAVLTGRLPARCGEAGRRCARLYFHALANGWLAIRETPTTQVHHIKKLEMQNIIHEKARNVKVYVQLDKHDVLISRIRL